MWRRVPRSPFRPALRAGLATILLLALATASIGCEGDTGTPAAQPPSATPSPVISPSFGGRGGRGGGLALSATDQLGEFFAGAQRIDAQLRHAAVMVNDGVGRTTIKIDHATAQAVSVIDTRALSKTIPGGVNGSPSLRDAVLLVYSDLTSRQRSLSRVVRYDGQTLARSGGDARELLECLGNGGPAAARFADDLATAKARAATTAPLPAVADDSRQVASIAVLAALINLANAGCDACGGYVMTRPLPLVWTKPSMSEVMRIDGTVDGIPFQADYRNGLGWQVQLMAC